MWQSISLLKSFLNDELGAIVSAELALVGTMGVVGATVGLSTAATSVQEELNEVASVFRSLDQSYSIPEQRIGNAWTAGSSYMQPVRNEKPLITPEGDREDATAKGDSDKQTVEPEPRQAGPSL